MNVEFVEIIGINVPVFLGGVFVSFLIFSFFLYFTFKKRIKTFVIFDLSVLLFFAGMVFSRLLSVIDRWSVYSEYNWAFLPVRDTGEEIFFERVLPWEVINILDGNLILWLVPIGILIGGLLVYLSSNRKIDLAFFTDSIILAVIPVQLVLSFTAILLELYYGNDSGGLDLYIDQIGEHRLNIPLIEIGAFVIGAMFIIAIYFLKSRKGLVTALYLIINGILGTLLFSNSSFVNNRELHLLISGGIIIWGIVTAVFAVIKKSEKRVNNKVSTEKTTLVEGNELIKQKVLTDIESERRGVFAVFRRIFRG